jgi:ubiquinone/menaquinone biosynthesis C-methylase UbiE
MTEAARNDVWTQGAAYELYVGRWSRLAASEFLRWIAVADGGTWLDVGCGTGALSQRILDGQAPARVVGVDPSEGFISHARAHVSDRRAEFRVGDARSLPVGDKEFDAVVSGLVLNFVSDQPRALAEMRRAVRPDGKVAIYVWDYAGDMQLMRYFWDTGDLTRSEGARPR